MKKIFLFVVLFSSSAFSQFVNINLFPHRDIQNNYLVSAATSTSNGNLFFFWGEKNKMYFSKSINNGATWSARSSIYAHSVADSLIEINAVTTLTGRILVVIKAYYTYSIYSNDFGSTWSMPVRLIPGTTPLTSTHAVNQNVTITPSGIIYLTYVRNLSTIYRLESTDNGENWSSEKTLFAGGSSPSIVSLGGGIELLIFLKHDGGKNKIALLRSSDFGLSWQTPETQIHQSAFEIFSVKAIKDNNNKIWMAFNTLKTTVFSGYFNQEIEYITSINSGISWSSVASFTKYKGYDGRIKLQLCNNKPFLTFSSDRDLTNIKYNNYLWYGVLGESNDLLASPYVFKTQITRTNSIPSTANVKVWIEDDSGISSVYLQYHHNNHFYLLKQMFDSGRHSDSLANDNIYGVELSGLESGDILEFYIKSKDLDNNEALQYISTLTIPFDNTPRSYFLDVNRIKLPINNAGILADVYIDNKTSGKYDGEIVLYSAGFFLSGISNAVVWSNAVASASRIEDYRAGNVRSHVNDSKNIVYVLSADDAAFGPSWQKWKDAVSIGAEFYDGNRDGIYNPKDLNGNNVWDRNEDKPDILGDVTLFCVYNDATPSHLRRFNQVSPMGIEIHQTVFAYKDSSQNTLNNSIFVRYKIINKGTENYHIDSVYFSLWADPDIGDYNDDLVGCDTTLNAGYAYNNGTDLVFGNAPPAVISTLLQGPYAYIPGVSFIDNNGNNTYEPQIDTPLDTAYSRKGELLGVKIVPGATNLAMTSFFQNMKSHPTIGDPNTHFEARNYLKATDKLGLLINPCNWMSGQVSGGINCATVNSNFLYSGNPVTNIGWNNISKFDQRIFVNTGPFSLKQGEPIEIIGAISVGRDNSVLSSITEAKRISRYITDFYKSNFGASIDNYIDSSVFTYELFQNYPNPFNPITVISWQSPVVGHTTLKVYDILGREVAVLLNEAKQPGGHSVEFNGSKFASGVYFYRIEIHSDELRSGSFMGVKKLMLLK